MVTEKDFFFPDIKVEEVDEEQYKRFEPLVCSTEAMARVLYQSVYLIDYCKGGFLYVSDNPLFLC